MAIPLRSSSALNIMAKMMMMMIMIMIIMVMMVKMIMIYVYINIYNVCQCIRQVYLLDDIQTNKHSLGVGIKSNLKMKRWKRMMRN